MRVRSASFMVFLVVEINEDGKAGATAQGWWTPDVYEPSLMGRAISFGRNDLIVTVKIPPIERVGDSHDENALAHRGAWNSKTGEAIYYVIHMVDVLTTCASEVELPPEVLIKHPNAYELIDKTTQDSLNLIANETEAVAVSGFEYWVSLLRWVTGSYSICRATRVGSSSGWSTYLHDSLTEKPVWIASQTFVVHGYRTVTGGDWARVQQLSAIAEEPPIYAVLHGDALDCLEFGDYRRALVDLSVACEVFLRTYVLRSLPAGVPVKVMRLIEEANINQFVSHLFPALLGKDAKQEYKKTIKDELSSLFSRRNKLMHVAELHGATLENCRRYERATKALFQLLPPPSPDQA